MQGVAIAVIGFFGLLIPALISIGSVHVRLLRRLKSEVEAFNELPEDFHQERELARYLINESMWSYAKSRGRLLHPIPYIALGLVTTLMMTFGLELVKEGDPSAFLDLNDDPNYRAMGIGLLVSGLIFYVRVLAEPFVATRRRIKRIGSMPSRLTQLIAMEAHAASLTTLDQFPVGETRRDLESDPLSRRMRSWMWSDLDALGPEPQVSATSGGEADPDES